MSLIHGEIGAKVDAPLSPDSYGHYHPGMTRLVRALRPRDRTVNYEFIPRRERFSIPAVISLQLCDLDFNYKK